VSQRPPSRGADALLLVSFGGPEGPEEVRPFLESVVVGRGVPPERLEEAARHYDLFGGVSPLNARNRALVAALRERLIGPPFRMPVYWGNRFSRPTVEEAVRAMRGDGVSRALAFVTSAFDSPAGFTRYLESVARARVAVGAGAPAVEVLPPFWSQPLFETAQADSLARGVALAYGRARVVFTAHSIPFAMASRCRYDADLATACARAAGACGVTDWVLAYQSRSGSPGQPWLGPDVRSVLERAAADGVETVVVCPIGFVTDHMEVCYDLDVEARMQAEGLGMGFVRCETVDRHPAFVEMILSMTAEKVGDGAACLVGAP
jgi:protoporphyrin/coproporphyrin ferrochelatase